MLDCFGGDGDLHTTLAASCLAVDSNSSILLRVEMFSISRSFFFRSVKDSPTTFTSVGWARIESSLLHGSSSFESTKSMCSSPTGCRR